MTATTRLNLTFTSLLILLILLLQGCAGAVLGGAAAGVTVSHDRRTTGIFIEDQAIEVKAMKRLFDDKEILKNTHLGVTSFNRQVLLTGESPQESLRQRAEQLVSGIANVRHVFNEVVIAAPTSVLSRTNDTYLGTKVKSKFLAQKGLDPTRIKVVTQDGTVFLMGLVNRAEAETATDITRRTAGVQRVVPLYEYVD
ncbi:MAG: BON domain-containing protein [Gammaproteobacteria bacterium]|nr:BON domain-containing protein [Gammaproteobacteria bacterium]